VSFFITKPGQISVGLEISVEALSLLQKGFYNCFKCLCVVGRNVYLYNWLTLLLCSSTFTRKMYNIFAMRVVKLSTRNVGCLKLHSC
jgi:hypothetical protein